jgi:four helix bundle protein
LKKKVDMPDLDSAKPRHYKVLLVWQKGMELAKAVYRLTAAFPAEEKYGLATQMRRAAVAIPSNIAEGQARHGTREFMHFLSKARGSFAELETQLLLSVELGYCNSTETKQISEKLESCKKC